MAEPCKHVFDDRSAVFTGTARVRACLKCNRIEVMLVSTGKWMFLDEYVHWKIANRTGAS